MTNNNLKKASRKIRDKEEPVWKNIYIYIYMYISYPQKNVCNTFKTKKIKQKVTTMKYPYILYSKKNTLPSIFKISFLPRIK